MKKIFCIVVVIIIIILGFGIVRYYSNKNTDEIGHLQLIDEVTDKYDNILQQTFYNEKTGDYFIKEYTYILQQKKWVCIDQQFTMLPNREMVQESYSSETNPILKVYYNNDILSGPITIMDNEYAKITIIKYLAKDNWWEFGYELKIVNKTNKILTITFDDTSIMDTRCRPVFTIDHVDANHTTYFSLCWDKETLERNYIPYIDNIEFMVRVYDNENWTIPALAGEQILIKN